MAGAGMRLQPPDKYDGETDFDRFSKLLRAYMGCQDRDYSDMLHHAETSQTPITHTELFNSWTVQIRHDGWSWTETTTARQV